MPSLIVVLLLQLPALLDDVAVDVGHLDFAVCNTRLAVTYFSLMRDVHVAVAAAGTDVSIEESRTSAA
jgi:hypothetical protein